MNRAGYIGASSKHSISDTAATFTVAGAPESRHALIIQSDVVAYVTRDGTTASADNGFRLVADVPCIINTFAGDVVSFIGESSGNLYVTETDH